MLKNSPDTEIYGKVDLNDLKRYSLHTLIQLLAKTRENQSNTIIVYFLKGKVLYTRHCVIFFFFFLIFYQAICYLTKHVFIYISIISIHISLVSFQVYNLLFTQIHIYINNFLNIFICISLYVYDFTLHNFNHVCYKYIFDRCEVTINNNILIFN